MIYKHSVRIPLLPQRRLEDQIAFVIALVVGLLIGYATLGNT